MPFSQEFRNYYLAISDTFSKEQPALPTDLSSDRVNAIHRCDALIKKYELQQVYQRLSDKNLAKLTVTYTLKHMIIENPTMPLNEIVKRLPQALETARQVFMNRDSGDNLYALQTSQRLERLKKGMGQNPVSTAERTVQSIFNGLANKPVSPEVDRLLAKAREGGLFVFGHKLGGSNELDTLLKECSSSPAAARPTTPAAPVVPVRPAGAAASALPEAMQADMNHYKALKKVKEEIGPFIEGRFNAVTKQIRQEQTTQKPQTRALPASHSNMLLRIDAALRDSYKRLDGDLKPEERFKLQASVVVAYYLADMIKKQPDQALSEIVENTWGEVMDQLTKHTSEAAKSFDYLSRTVNGREQTALTQILADCDNNVTAAPRESLTGFSGAAGGTGNGPDRGTPASGAPGPWGSGS